MKGSSKCRRRGGRRTLSSFLFRWNHADLQTYRLIKGRGVSEYKEYQLPWRTFSKAHSKVMKVKSTLGLLLGNPAIDAGRRSLRCVLAPVVSKEEHSAELKAACHSAEPSNKAAGNLLPLQPPPSPTFSTKPSFLTLTEQPLSQRLIILTFVSSSPQAQ